MFCNVVFCERRDLMALTKKQKVQAYFEAKPKAEPKDVAKRFNMATATVDQYRRQMNGQAKQEEAHEEEDAARMGKHSSTGDHPVEVRWGSHEAKEVRRRRGDPRRGVGPWRGIQATSLGFRHR